MCSIIAYKMYDKKDKGFKKMKIEEWLNNETSLIATKLIEYNKKHIEIEKSIGFTGRDKIHEILDNFYEIFSRLLITKVL